MWLTTPETIEHILVERPLEPASDEALDQSAHEWQSRGVKLAPREALRNLPVASIGQPETWALHDLYPPRKMPRSIRAKLNRSDFYLVRLSCSFRPLHQESHVEWARFRATLLPHPTTGEQPLAFDFYPQHVMQGVKHQTKVTLSPMLKFQELEASLGSAEFGFDYTEQTTLVSATIGSSFDPSWDYRAGPGRDVSGTKWMYLLVKAPKGMTSGRALLELEADVLVRGARLSVVFWRQQEQATAQLTVPLWGLTGS
jgi:hypothetical protein